MDSVRLIYTFVLIGYLLFMLLIGYITSKKNKHGRKLFCS